MKIKNVKDWKTTLTGIIGGVVVIAGIVWPDKLDADTGQAIETAAGEIIVGVGALIAALSGIFAKDE
jgi:hypothetical protein